MTSIEYQNGYAAGYVDGKHDGMRLAEELEDWHWPKGRERKEGEELVIEYECPHGVGHGGTHGCDGCCSHRSYPDRRKKDGNTGMGR